MRQWHRTSRHVSCSGYEPSGTIPARMSVAVTLSQRHQASRPDTVLARYHCFKHACCSGTELAGMADDVSLASRHVLGSHTEPAGKSVAVSMAVELNQLCLMSEAVAPSQQTCLRQWNRTSRHVSYIGTKSVGISEPIVMALQLCQR